jgi:hypothetical protein
MLQNDDMMKMATDYKGELGTDWFLFDELKLDCLALSIMHVY